MKSAFFGLIFGILFAIIPIIVISVNGYVLGFVMQRSINQSGILILWRLFPHGIFEMPAILIVMGLGIRAGTFLFNKNLKKSGFWELIFTIIKVYLLIVIPLLVIAGIIEGSIMFLLK